MCCLLKLHKKWFNGSMAVKKPYITKGKQGEKKLCRITNSIHLEIKIGNTLIFQHVFDPKHIVNAVKAHLELLHK